MRMYDIIKKKRDGFELTGEEINFVIDGYMKEEIPDYQVSALLMAIFYKGMNNREIADLTFAMRDSGEKLHFEGLEGLRVDKHSTGGVGDKTSLIVAPIVASLGVKVAKMSGRGLGHTGGTIDKLEAIKGFRTDIPLNEFIDIVNEVGISIIGQTKDLAPADKKLYALRDVTATVESIPLVVSSIMSKKLAANDDCVVLDVKTGSGAICKTLEDSVTLASIMVDIGKKAGKKMMAIITDMDRPLGNNVGNSLEVIEAIETLKGNGPEDLTEICLILAASMLHIAGFGDVDACKQIALNQIQSGKAFRTFVKMVEKQSGDVDCVLNPDHFEKAKYSLEIKAPRSGYITHMNTEEIGISSLMLGAGRNKKEDAIDYSAGIILNKKTYDYINEGELLATLYTNKPDALEQVKEKMLNATVISDELGEVRPLVFKTII